MESCLLDLPPVVLYCVSSTHRYEDMRASEIQIQMKWWAVGVGKGQRDKGSRIHWG